MADQLSLRCKATPLSLALTLLTDRVEFRQKNDQGAFHKSTLTLNLDDKTFSIFKINLSETESVEGNGQVWLLVILAIFQPYDLIPGDSKSNNNHQ